MRSPRPRALCVSLLVAAAGLAAAPPASAQPPSGRAHWRRTSPPPAAAPRVFHASWAVALPTATTIQKGTFRFEVGHRFLQRFSDGLDALYGIDGPARVRLALAWGITDRVTATLGRTSFRDQVDLQLKAALPDAEVGNVPLRAALHGGVAWTTDNAEFPGRSDTDGRAFQFYLQGILNLRPVRRIAVGIVPSYLYNAVPESDEVEHAAALGLYGQVYLNRVASVVAEWNITEAGYFHPYDAVAFGIELETGGHFFKIVATNSEVLNLAQVLAGAVHRTDPVQWRLGFQITRLLRF